MAVGVGPVGGPTGMAVGVGTVGGPTGMAVTGIVVGMTDGWELTEGGKVTEGQAMVGDSEDSVICVIFLCDC